MKKNATFLFYDYETFGLNPCLDKPAQFASIRTDLDFNILEEPNVFYCFPPDDYLPDPSAVLITHITPQYTYKYGSNEYNFTKKIYDIFTQSNTCIMGYNNINFDDEVTRNIFYRNFFDPYEWSWKNFNTRWDVLNILRACYVLRPDGIKWPKNELGLPNFKLSELTKKNNIIHKNAHNALSDVYATIEIAKLIKKKQPKLFMFFFKYRIKKNIFLLINKKKFTPIVHISNIFGSVRNNMSVIFPIKLCKHDFNKFITIDLFSNVKKLISLLKNTVLDNITIKDLFKYGVVVLRLNRCPILAPIQSILIKDFERLNINNKLYKENIILLKKNVCIFKKIEYVICKQYFFKKSNNVDAQLYDAFFNITDKILIKNIRNSQFTSLNNIHYHFNDVRLKELLFRCRARNFFYTLHAVEKEKWFDHCCEFFNVYYVNEYKQEIYNLLQQYSLDVKKIDLLNDLLDYCTFLSNKYSLKIFN